MQITFNVNLDLKGELVHTITRALLNINRTLLTMSDQATQIQAALDALKAKNDQLIALAASIKASLDAAVAGGNGMTAAEVQTLVDNINAIAAADDAAITADTPAAPAPAPAPAEPPPATA